MRPETPWSPPWAGAIGRRSASRADFGDGHLGIEAPERLVDPVLAESVFDWREEAVIRVLPYAPVAIPDVIVERDFPAAQAQLLRQGGGRDERIIRDDRQQVRQEGPRRLLFDRRHEVANAVCQLEQGAKRDAAVFEVVVQVAEMAARTARDVAGRCFDAAGNVMKHAEAERKVQGVRGKGKRLQVGLDEDDVLVRAQVVAGDEYGVRIVHGDEQIDRGLLQQDQRPAAHTATEVRTFLAVQRGRVDQVEVVVELLVMLGLAVREVAPLVAEGVDHLFLGPILRADLPEDDDVVDHRERPVADLDAFGADRDGCAEQGLELGH